MNPNRHGSPTFYSLLDELAKLHDEKSHDYASNDNPSGNYHFAGELAMLFKHSSKDAGFVGRIGEKLYRLANLESSRKTPKNETIEDTERDICVIICLWMADRRDRRNKPNLLQTELLDLITLMPDSQTQEIIDYILELRKTRNNYKQTQKLSLDVQTESCISTRNGDRCVKYGKHDIHQNETGECWR